MNISRYTDTTELKFDVEFVTPTFLGGAYGNAEIRTAPFKNLLRRWWRIVNGRLSPEELWKKESELFGSTEKNPDTGKIFGKSKVELKIEGIENVQDLLSNQLLFIGKDGISDLALYTGYGSVSAGKNIRQNEKTYIKAGTKIKVSLRCPSYASEELKKSLFCIHLFGAIGSRSRNGWGSISLFPKSFNFDIKKHFPNYVKFKDALSGKKLCPFCIAADDFGILCWKTSEFDSWKIAFEMVAKLYHQLIQDLKSDDKKYNTEWRKLLGFADSNTRSPSQLLLKVVSKVDKFSQKKFYGMIIHIPYLVQNWEEKSDNEQFRVWKFVHEWLDNTDELNGMFGRKKITGAGK